jgi:nucleoside-diphosphate-sugar epimerase
MGSQSLNSESNILVTGVTGLIGGELLRALEFRHTGRLWGLIRPHDDLSARKRWEHRLQRSGESLETSLDSRVLSLSGDVTQADWGLANDELESVLRNVDIIIHSAADTSFLRRAVVENTNIQGTHNLIHLAKRCRRRPLIVYISTATNVGKASRCCLSEIAGCQPDNEHFNDYTRSKAVAEQLLRESGLPVLTLRPTIVLSAGLPDRDFAQSILWFIPLIRRFDAFPLDPASRLDMVPISFVVDSTIDLLKRPKRYWDCYHISAGNRFAQTIGDLSVFADRYYQRRLPLRLVKPSCWQRTDQKYYVRSMMQRKIYHALRYYLPFANMDVVFDNHRLETEFHPIPLEIPKTTSYLGEILSRITPNKALQESARP